jgi:hypothetical protein
MVPVLIQVLITDIFSDLTQVRPKDSKTRAVRVFGFMELTGSHPSHSGRSETIVSPTFPELKLTAAIVLGA